MNTNTSNAEYDIMKHKYDDKWESENSEDILPAGGYSIIAWMALPPLPNDNIIASIRSAKEEAEASK